MDEIQREYEKINMERCHIIEEIGELAKDEKVRRYQQLKKRNEILYNRQLEIYRDMRFAKYDACSHIYICNKIDYKNRLYKNYICIKCGLDLGMADSSKDDLSQEYQLMHDYLRGDHVAGKGIVTTITCDSLTAEKIYNELKKENPEITDEEVVAALEHEVSEMRKTRESDLTLKRVISNDSKDIR